MPKNTILLTVHFYYGYGRNRECYCYKYAVDFDINDFIEYLKGWNRGILHEDTVRHLYVNDYLNIDSIKADSEFLEFLEEKYYEEARCEFRETEHELYEQLFDND